jgi:phage gp46-like protein
MIKIAYDAASQTYDLVESPGGNLELDHGLTTAILISLLTDARADGQRGWWGAAYSRSGEPWGSTLWRELASPRDATFAARVRSTAEAALAWLVSESFASAVTISVDSGSQNVILSIVITKPGSGSGQAAWEITIHGL